VTTQATPPPDAAAAERQTARLLLACLDLTSLNDADDAASVDRLAARADGPCGRPAALCVWPRLAAHAVRVAPAGVVVPAVANFPAGGTDVQSALHDAGTVVDAGAHELDLVLPWRALRDGDAAAAARVVSAVRRATPGLRLKLILETGELRDDALIRRAAALGLAEGADVLKTSTGKTPVGATPQAARALLETIAATPGSTAGLKVAGGVRRVADGAPYLALVHEVLGPAALGPRRFRVGASGLLDDIEAVLGAAASAAPPDAGY
jgi:deoxyribose-phosphate aldolase